MKIEERLHDAMHEYADTIEPEPDSWTRISARCDDSHSPVRQPSRRPLVLAGVAAVAIVVLVAGLIARDTDDGSRVVTDPDTPSVTDPELSALAAMPERIFAVTTDGHPVVLASGTSQRLTGFGDVAGLALGTQIAPAPDGEHIYVVQGEGNEGCADHSILRLTMGTPGTSELVAAEATSPTVSPDGRYLAYLHCLSGNARAAEIVRLDLSTGAFRIVAAPVGTFFINRLEFAADSRHVLYQLFDDTLGRDTLYELDLVGTETPPGREVGISVGSPGWAGIRGTTGQYLGVNTLDTSVSSIEPTPPFTTAPLFALPSRATQVSSDRSGRHIAAVADGALYRWSEGDDEPTQVVGSYQGAAWLSASPAPDSSVRFGADALIPRDFPSAVPLPDAGPLRSVVSEKNPPNASFTMTYALGGRDGNAVGDAYRRKLQNAGFQIDSFSAAGGTDSAITQFDAIGKKWDVAVESGKRDPRLRATVWVQVRTHGSPKSSPIGFGDTTPDVTAPPG